MGECGREDGPLDAVLDPVHLDGDEKELYKSFERVVSLGTDLFRFYANISGGEPHLYLSIEFLERQERKFFWSAVDAFVTRFNGKLWVMDKSMNTQKSWRDVDGKQADVEYGENYGHMEKQVAIDFSVAGESKKEVSERIQRMREYVFENRVLCAGLVSVL